MQGINLTSISEMKNTFTSPATNLTLSNGLDVLTKASLARVLDIRDNPSPPLCLRLQRISNRTN